MRKILILSAMFLLITSAKAQSFMFYRGDQPLEDNAEYTVSDYDVFMTGDDYVILSMESGLELKNITGNDVQATVAQTILDGPLDGENGYLSFCFQECTTGNNNKTMSGLITANSFSIGYHTNFYVYEGIYNRITVKYEVYLATGIGKPNLKTVTVTYVYDANSTAQLNKTDITPALNVFQEGDQVKINGAFGSNNCQLEVYNLMGQKLAQHLLSSADGTFSLPEKLTKGVYICVIKNGKQTAAMQKFIVK